LPKLDAQFIFFRMFMTRRNLDWWCERGILSLVMTMLVFAPLAFGAADTWEWLVVQGLAMGVFVLWVVRLWAQPKPRLLWPPLCWVVVAFVLYAVARYFTADIEYVARQELLQVLVFGFLFFAAVNNLRGQEEISAVCTAMIAAGTFAACYAVAQLTHHSNQVWNQISPYIGRASGTYISPNNLAGLLAMLLPLALAYLLVGKVKVVTRILLGYAALAMAAGLAVTFSRGGYVAGAVGVVLLLGILLGHGNHRLKAALLLAVTLAVGGFFVSHYLSKTVGYMRRVADPEAHGALVIVDASTASRLAMWGAAVQMWRDNPWFGVGPAHYDYRFREYRPEVVQGRPDRVHNDYLNLLADWGVIGGVIVVAGMGIFVFWLAKTWPHVRREENDFGSGQSNRFAFFLGALCGLAALAAHSIMDFNLHIPANALVGVTLLGLATSNVRYATESYWFRARTPLKVALSVTLAALTAELLLQEWHGAGESRWLAKAERLPNFSPQRAAALEKAFACETKNFQTAYDIGECYRTESLDGGDNFASLGEKAISWYARAIQLDPHDGYSYLRTGMCLDWLGRTEKSPPFYAAAEARDPNGYFMVANIGWHFVQTRDYAAALEWFARSLKLDYRNDIAENYIPICQSKLAEKASGQTQLPPGF
jgi:O-antigen ligase